MQKTILWATVALSLFSSALFGQTKTAVACEPIPEEPYFLWAFSVDPADLPSYLTIKEDAPLPTLKLAADAKVYGLFEDSVALYEAELAAEKIIDTKNLYLMPTEFGLHELGGYSYLGPPQLINFDLDVDVWGRERPDDIAVPPAQTADLILLHDNQIDPVPITLTWSLNKDFQTYDWGPCPSDELLPVTDLEPVIEPDISENTIYAVAWSLIAFAVALAGIVSWFVLRKE